MSDVCAEVERYLFRMALIIVSHLLIPIGFIWAMAGGR